MKKIPELSDIRIESDNDSKYVVISLTACEEPKKESEELTFFTSFKVPRKDYFGLIAAFISLGVDMEKKGIDLNMPAPPKGDE